MSKESKESFVVTGKSYTAVAINTAAKAGQWIKSKLGDFENLQLKASHSDLVTEIDRGSELMIRNLIHTYFPEHAFLGEEGIEADSDRTLRSVEQIEEEEFVWIVDPIDGTTNFVHGFPYFCVSIALVHKGELAVGVIYDPMRDELFVAEKGKGAYLKGTKLNVSAESKLSECLIATGFPVERERLLPLNLAGIQHLAPKVRNIRAAGSAALHLAYVAAGRLSGFWELNLNPWDLAAGALLVQEAGGQITDTMGRPYTLGTRNVLSSNGKIHDDFVSSIRDAGATGF